MVPQHSVYFVKVSRLFYGIFVIFQADLHVMSYLGFKIDFCERIGLIIMKSYPMS